MQEPDFIPLLYPVEKIFKYCRTGNLHDELMEMNYICYYDALSQEQQKHLVDIDLKTVRAYCLSHDDIVVHIGCDLEEFAFKMIKNHFN